MAGQGRAGQVYSSRLGYAATAPAGPCCPQERPGGYRTRATQHLAVLGKRICEFVKETVSTKCSLSCNLT